MKEVDKLHLRFCKPLLGVIRSTPNLAVYGELGRFPFSLLDKHRALKFWIKVMKNHLSLQYKLYNEQCKINNAKSLAKRVHSIKNHIGLHTMSCINTLFSTNFSEHTKKATNTWFNGKSILPTVSSVLNTTPVSGLIQAM